MKSLVCLFAVALVAAAGVALADDYNPPDWRGQENTTFQRWEFGDENPNPAPDLLDNPLGDPTLQVAGSAPFTLWLAQDSDRSGVWKFEDYVQITIQNFDEQRPYKEIWIQLTYSADADPLISTVPGSTGGDAPIDKEQVGTLYWHATYSLRIEPNPDQETIYIQPRNCTTFIDEIVIDTICVPEPLTVCLLGLGGLALLRKRRA